jgi:SAM-dependent methyltransferase
VDLDPRRARSFVAQQRRPGKFRVVAWGDLLRNKNLGGTPDRAPSLRRNKPISCPTACAIIAATIRCAPCCEDHRQVSTWSTNFDDNAQQCGHGVLARPGCGGRTGSQATWDAQRTTHCGRALCGEEWINADATLHDTRLVRAKETPHRAMHEPGRSRLWQTLSGETWRHAKRVLAIGTSRLLRVRLGRKWETADGRLQRRTYDSYELYVRHQRMKLDQIRTDELRHYDRLFYTALRDRLRTDRLSLAGHSVLCLGARQGTEVRVFIDEGAFAVGIDLNPGAQNRYVVVGDFHDLQFADGSVDIVYTNALDHAFDIDRVLTEVRRVLADTGLLVVDIVLGTAQESRPGFYESLAWTTTDDLVHIILRNGFVEQHRCAFTVPWRGEHVVFRKRADSSAVASCT